MLMKNLINEYELRYRFTMYKKLHKMYLYNKFEINNYNLLLQTFEDMLEEESLIKEKVKNIEQNC